MNILYYLNLCANKENFGQYCLGHPGTEGSKERGMGESEERGKGGSEVVFRKYYRLLL